MVSPPPAADADADPAWIARLRSILGLNQCGVVVGLDGAHLACAKPLLELLSAEGGPVRICFEALELLDLPEDARVVLFHAARDAEVLNRVRPIIAERRLRVLIWLEPGDRREMSRRARDFLDWMQESVDIPAFAPGYAEAALREAIEDGVSLSWAGLDPSELIPDEGVPLLMPDAEDADVLMAMRAGPVIVHRARGAEIERFEALHRQAGRGAAIIWDEADRQPAGARSVNAEQVDWEGASRWLAEAGIAEPRITAAKLDLDPEQLGALAGAAAPWTHRALERCLVRGYADDSPRARESDASAPAARGLVPLSATLGELADVDDVAAKADGWWGALEGVCRPVGPPIDPELIVERPAAWGSLSRIVDELREREEPGVHLVTGGPGSGVSTELASLASRLHAERCVVMFDVGAHGEHALGDRWALRSMRSWELLFLVGLAAIRVGEARWQVRWGRELHQLERAFTALSGLEVDAKRLAEALEGVAAPDATMASTRAWDLPMGAGRSEHLVAELEPRAIDELASVVQPHDMQMWLVGAGLLSADLPRLELSARDYWDRVRRLAADGVVDMRAILARAAQRYLGNPKLRRWHELASGSGDSPHARRELALAIRAVFAELRRVSGRELVLLVDGLALSRRADADGARARELIDDIIDSIEDARLMADVISTVPLGYEPGQRVIVRSCTRLDDVPVVDVDAPTERGPGIAWMRELIELRLASIPLERPSIPDALLDQLVWASGGRPGLCMRLFRRVARKASIGSPRSLVELAELALDQLRSELTLPLGSAPRELLVDLLQSFVRDLPDDPPSYLLEEQLIHRYPTPDGGHRYLPAPVLIEGLLAGRLTKR